MGRETERKFLVKGSDYQKDAFRSMRMTQGYLNSAPERSVRIRLCGESGYITVKGPTEADGISHFEWEKEIPYNEAQDLLQLCEPGVIDKTRYYVRTGQHIFEVDEFHGENKGLVIAEIELREANETFELPAWLGEEVTGDVRYYNASLTHTPYSRWK